MSTMLYLMALQELTKCPFRVVDEINQVGAALNSHLKHCPYRFSLVITGFNIHFSLFFFTFQGLFHGFPKTLNTKIIVFLVS